MATTRLMTVEDLANLDDVPGRYDLIRGELIRMSPSGFRHGVCSMRIARQVANFAEVHALGEVPLSNTGFVLSRNPDVLLAPDVAFVSADRLPPADKQSGFLELALDLVVEVVSPSDLFVDASEKLLEYLDAGVQVVWIVDPRRKTVSVYSPDRTAIILTGDDVLDGGTVLPGSQLPLPDVFR